MKNRFLREGALSIPYYPALRQHCGNIGATILMQQLDFLFGLTTKSGKKFEDGFYKFLEPVPKHEKYVDGDSWCEALSITPDEFRTLFDKIGTRYSSLTAYRKVELAGGDPFVGKFYLSIVDRKSNLTWYHRNHKKVDALLDVVLSGNITQHTDFKAPAKPHLQEMENSISTDGKKQGQELANTSLHNTETTPEITSTTTNDKNQVVVVDEIEDLVKAAVWSFEKGGAAIKKMSGFKHAVRKRILESGPSSEDIQNLRDWITQNDKSTKSAEEKNLILAQTAFLKIDQAAVEKGEQILTKIREQRNSRKAD